MGFVQLPAAVVEELQRFVREAVGDALIFHGAQSSDEHIAVIRAVRKYCVDTLANFTVKPRASSWPRLPPEVMLVFAHLLDRDELHDIAQVCRSWRSMLVQEQRLWTLVDFSSNAPGLECDCCRYNHYYGLKPDLETRLRRELAMLRCSVQRSDGLPLDIRLHIEHQTPHPLIFTGLISIIKQAAGRIKSLGLRFESTNVFNKFIGLLPDLPALRVLVVDPADGQITDLNFRAYSALRTLYINGHASWRNSSIPGLAGIEELHMSASSPSDFTYVSATFPHLKILRLDCTHSWRDASDEEWDAVAAFIGRLQDVSLEYSMEHGWNTEDIFRVVSGATKVPRLALDCYPYTYMGLEIDDALAPYAILGHLEGHVSLHWTSIEDTIELVGTDAQERVRSISVTINQDFAPSLKSRALEVVGDRALEDGSITE